MSYLCNLLVILMFFLYIPSTESAVTIHDQIIKKYVDNTLTFYGEQGVFLSSDIDVYCVTRSEYAKVVGKTIAQNSDGCTIGSAIYVVRESFRKDFIVAHELTHQVQRQLYGDGIFKHRFYCEGTADQIASKITGKEVTKQNWRLKEFQLNNKSYEQANWMVYTDSKGRPDVNYMITKGEELLSGTK